MPIKQGSSSKTVSSNIRELIGKKKLKSKKSASRMALAIALKSAGKSNK